MAATLLFDSLVFDDVIFGGEVASLFDTELFDPVVFDVGEAPPLSNYEISADSGSLAISAQAVFNIVGRSLNLQSRILSISPQVVFNTKQWYINSTGTSYINTGQPSFSAKGYVGQLDQASFIYTTSDVSINVSRNIDSALGSFSISGIPNTWSIDKVLSASNSTFNNAVFSVSNYRGYLLVATASSINLVGQDASLVKQSIVVANSNSYVYNGQATLAAQKTLVLSSRQVSVSGEPTYLLQTKVISTAGQLSISGSNTYLSKSTIYNVNPGTYAHSGIPSVLLLSRALNASVGNIQLSGQNAELLIQQPNTLLIADATSYSNTYAVVANTVSRAVSTNSSYSLTATNISNIRGYVLSSSSYSLVNTTQNLTVLHNKVCIANSGQIVITYPIVANSHSKTLVAGPSTVSISHGSVFNFRTYSVNANVQAHTITGQQASLLKGTYVSTSGALSIQLEPISSYSTRVLKSDAFASNLSTSQVSVLRNFLLKTEEVVIDSTALTAQLTHNKIMGTVTSDYAYVTDYAEDYVTTTPTFQQEIVYSEDYVEQDYSNTENDAQIKISRVMFADSTLLDMVHSSTALIRFQPYPSTNTVLNGVVYGPYENLVGEYVPMTTYSRQRVVNA